MKSRWYEFKNQAIDLRRKGFSMNVIEKRYGIARSTLSGWFKGIKLTSTQKKKLLQKSKLLSSQRVKRQFFGIMSKKEEDWKKQKNKRLIL